MQEFKNDTFQIKIHDGIIFVELYKEFMDYEDMDLGVKTRLEMTKDKYYPFITDMRAVKTITPAGRKRMAEKDAEYGTTAVALVVRSKIQSILYSLFCLIYKSNMPFKVFTNKTSAIKWVQQYKQIVPELEIEAINNNTTAK